MPAPKRARRVNDWLDHLKPDERETAERHLARKQELDVERRQIDKELWPVRNRAYQRRAKAEQSGEA